MLHSRMRSSVYSDTAHRLLRVNDSWRAREMDLAIWLPVTFVVGLVGLGVCYVFLLGCEKI